MINAQADGQMMNTLYKLPYYLEQAESTNSTTGAIGGGLMSMLGGSKKTPKLKPNEASSFQPNDGYSDGDEYRDVFNSTLSMFFK